MRDYVPFYAPRMHKVLRRLMETTRRKNSTDRPLGHLKPVIVMPSMNCLCMKAYRIITGTTVSIAPAA